MDTTRKTGILLHISSLPGPFGVGDVGPSARRFIDWLVEAKVRVWQLLPLVPPGPGQSPYGTAAALAGNPQFISPEMLVEDGWLEPDELRQDDGRSLDWAHWDEVLPRKEAMIRQAARRLVAAGDPSWSTFVAEQDWARQAALFFVLKRHHGQQPWWLWSTALKTREPSALKAFERRHRDEIDEELALLFLFEQQWSDLRAYARERGVTLFGDLPIYVARDSVDVWSNPEQFALDANLEPREVAGVPPDYFSETGQFWGNPLYDWGVMAQDGHAWWARRLARAMEQYDLVRIDHFRAFAGYWAIPANAPDATHGCWRPGPGKRLFDDVARTLARPLPLVAEDLGLLDASVHALRRELAIPGMVILQFAFGGDDDHVYLPHMHRPDQIAYTGTHDNDTTLGFWHSASESIKHHVRTYLGVDGSDIVWDLIAAAMGSDASMAVIPMQDLLCLDGGARFNTPGTITNNWSWRVRQEALNTDIAARLASLVVHTKRLG